MNFKELFVAAVKEVVNEREINRLIGKLPIKVLEAILNVNLPDNSMINEILEIIQIKKQQK